MDEDNSKPIRSALIAAGLLLGVLFALWYWVAIVPQIPRASSAAVPTPAQVAVTEAPSLRLHTPTPDPRHIAEQAYRYLLAREIENIATEVQIISTGLLIVDPYNPEWRMTMLESGVSLTDACDRLWVAVPPDSMKSVHSDVLKMADRYRTGARILLRDQGFVDAKSLREIAAQFEYGTNFMERVADYFER